MGGREFQEGAQFGAGSLGMVEKEPDTRALRGAHPVRQVLPREVTEPASRDSGEIEAAGARGEPVPEVLRLDEAGLLGLRRGHVDQTQVGFHLVDNSTVVRTHPRDVGLQERVDGLFSAGRVRGGA